jgi:hypothetical protein
MFLKNNKKNNCCQNMPLLFLDFHHKKIMWDGKNVILPLTFTPLYYLFCHPTSLLIFRIIPKIVMVSSITFFKKGFDSCTTPSQQVYNNPSHEGRPKCVGPTLM